MLNTFDPKSMFHTAENNRHAVDLLYRSMRDGSMHLSVPHTVLSALAIEIYLKCLIVIEDRKVLRPEHHLVALHKRLSANLRHELDQEAIPLLILEQRLMNAFWERVAFGTRPPPHLTVKSILTMGNKAFEKWRYVYEGKLENGEGFLGGVLIKLFRDKILAMRPDFAEPKV